MPTRRERELPSGEFPDAASYQRRLWPAMTRPVVCTSSGALAPLLDTQDDQGVAIMDGEMVMGHVHQGQWNPPDRSFANAGWPDRISPVVAAS